MGFRELKLKQMEKIAYARHGCNGNDFQVVSTQHTDVDSVPRPIVFEKRRIRGDGGTDSLQSYRPRILQRGELRIRGREIRQGFGQLVLARASPLTQAFNGAGRVLL